MNPHKIIGSNILAAREKCGKSAKEVADFLQCSLSLFYQYEQGNKAISAWALRQLAYLLNADYTAFFKGLDDDCARAAPHILIKESQNTPHILILEDDATDIYIFQENFQNMDIKLNTYHMRTAEEALNFLHKNNDLRLDLFFVDINLPGESGLSFLKTIRKNKKFAHTPVIIVTTDASQKTLDLATQAGASGYITKNPDPQQMSAMIHNTLRYWFQTTFLHSRAK